MLWFSDECEWLSDDGAGSVGDLSHRAGVRGDGSFRHSPAAGGMLGAAGIIVYDDSRCMGRAARACMRFYADESCGKCFPCRIGTERSAEVLDEIVDRRPRPDALGELADLARVMGEASACGLGLAAPLVVTSLVKYWPEEGEAHLSGRCPVGECEGEAT